MSQSYSRDHTEWYTARIVKAMSSDFALSVRVRMAHGSLSRHSSDTQPDTKKLRFNGTPDAHQKPAVCKSFSSSSSRPHANHPRARSDDTDEHIGSKEVVGTLSRILTMVADVTLSSDGMSGRAIGDTTVVHQVVRRIAAKKKSTGQKKSGTEKDKNQESMRHAADSRADKEALACEQRSTCCTTVKSEKSRGRSCWRCERWNKLPRASMVVVCGKEGSYLSVEPARRRGLSITSRRVEASFAGGPRTLKRETEPLEATEAEALLMGPQVVGQ